MLALRTDRGSPRRVRTPDARSSTHSGDEGSLTSRDGRVRLTDRGYLVLNELVIRLGETSTMLIEKDRRSCAPSSTPMSLTPHP